MCGGASKGYFIGRVRYLTGKGLVPLFFKNINKFSVPSPSHLVASGRPMISFCDGPTSRRLYCLDFIYYYF
jgi:hypothetical protein